MKRSRSPLAIRAAALAGGGLLASALPAAAAMPPYPAVTAARLAKAESDPGWLMFRRDYSGQAYAPFTAINPANVAKLTTVWSYNDGLKPGYEAAPIVNGRYMFVTTPMDHLRAFDALTGKLLWKYDRVFPPTATKTVCCDVVNRGVAVAGSLVYMATLDNHVLAFQATTGKIVWDTTLKPPGVGYALTVAPLVVDGKVIVGESGGEYGARGFIAALDAKTGAISWKRFTIPAPNQPGGDTWPKGAYKHGGGGAWLTGTYDPATKTLFWGVGNPGPWLATMRPGRNLYTDSVLALDPATGALKWYYQFTPHDTWDYDGTNESILADVTWKGHAYKAIVHADRNGYFYAIDRTTGKLIYARPFVHSLSIKSVTAAAGTLTNDAVRPTLTKGIFTCPSFLGGKNWWPMSVDPATGMAYVPTLHACMTMKGAPVSYLRGLPFLGESFQVVPQPGAKGWGSLQAIDLSTGKRVWQYQTKAPWNSGVLTTASGLVFSGRADGHLMAFDAKTGKVLWESPQLASGIVSQPSTFEIAGKQYVALWAGWGGASPIWGGVMANDPSIKNIPRGGHLYVFGLGK